jgi:hypothetical protein
MKDLFNHYQDQPEPLKKICDKWQQKLETDGLDYKDCKSFLNEVEKIGFTFEYGLDAEPFNLRKKEDEMYISEAIAKKLEIVLGLKSKKHRGRTEFQTSFGDKTHLGLGRTIIQIVEEYTGEKILN